MLTICYSYCYGSEQPIFENTDEYQSFNNYESPPEKNCGAVLLDNKSNSMTIEKTAR